MRTPELETSVDVTDALKVAGDPATSAKLLELLSRSEAEMVRAAVAQNASSPPEVIQALARDGSDLVRGLAERRLLVQATDVAIHPTALVHPSAVIGERVRIGPYSIVHERVQIGDGTVVGAHCELGHPAAAEADRASLVIGRNSFIRSHSVFYEGSTFGDNLVTGHRVTVREQTKAGRNFQIGTLCDIQGHCSIGDFVRFHSNVHIGQRSEIMDYVWIFPYVVLTNDPHPPSEVLIGVKLERYVAIATMSVVLPGVTIGEGALVGAHSSVTRDVMRDTVVAGAPAKRICETQDIKLKDGTGRAAYPWRRHFHRGYLPETVASWIAEFSAEASKSGPA